MIELPEGLTIARQLNATVVGRRVLSVLPPTKLHKFCWFAGPAAAYNEKIAGSVIARASAFGIYVEITFDNGQSLCFNDGVHIRLVDIANAPKAYQLLIALDDGTALCFSVAMYGGIILHGGDYDNAFYLQSKNAISPFDDAFEAHYQTLLDESKPTLSLKALIATEQRFPGVGNGTAQDILFAAGLHPKRKLETLARDEKNKLLVCVSSVLLEMTDKGGRDTEKDLFGKPGGYITKMSKKSLSSGCPVCGKPVSKETFLGGSVYYCPNCQPVDGTI